MNQPGQQPPENPRPASNRGKRYWAEFVLGSLIIAVLLILYSFVILALKNMPLGSDFSKFYVSARYHHEGKSIYDSVPYTYFGEDVDISVYRRPDMHPNLNPPFFTFLLLPLARFSYQTAFLIWSGISFILGLTSVVIIEKITARKSDIRRTMFFLILFLAYYPTFANVVFAQATFFLMFLMVAAWICTRESRDATAAIALGAAVALKPFFGLFFFFFTSLGRWRLLFYMALSTLIFSAVPLLSFNVSEYAVYARTIGTITWHGATWNASLQGFLSRIFGGSENPPLANLPLLADILYYTLFILGVALLCRVAFFSRRIKESFDITYSLVVILMLLLAPLAWLYYFPMLFLSFVVAWRKTTEMSLMYYYKLWIVTAWLLSTVPRMLMPARYVDDAAEWFLWGGYYFYALVILAALTLLITRRAARISVS
ncbi:glycosyltransferase family 87 protein [Candidatus Moduliflexota bacterium]